MHLWLCNSFRHGVRRDEEPHSGGEIVCGWERDGDREGERDGKWVVGEENESKKKYQEGTEF